MTDHPNTPSLARTARRRWAMFVLLLCCCLVYLLGLFGGFLFDDFPNIVDNPVLRAVDGSSFRWLALAVSSGAGLLRRPISMLSFGLDYYLFGLSPLAFKLTNLAIHLANGVALYQLARRITTRLLPAAHRAKFDPHALALLVAALWLLHPLNVSTVVYVVQRMDELATLFVLLGLLCYTEGRERMARGEHGMAIATLGIGAFGLLAAFSKENGALITAYALVIEVCCYQFAAGTTHANRTIKVGFWLTVALPIALFLAYLASHPQWLEHGYAARDFTLYQRLLSEARVLCDYLLWIVLPLPHWMGVFHDDFVASTGILHPATTLAAILFLLALVVAAWRMRRSHPGLIFAVAWFLVGQSMESTIIPLELVFDHRNYLPMAGLLLGLVCVFCPWAQARLNRRNMILCCCSAVLALAGTTATLAYAWGDPLRLALTEAVDHPHSARAQYEAGRQIIFTGARADQRTAAEQKATPYFEHSASIDPSDIYAISALIQISNRQSHSVPPTMISDLARRVRQTPAAAISTLLVVLASISDGDIHLTQDQMKSLVYSALDNPRFTHTMRAMILNQYGHYEFQIAADPQAAISLTMAAAAEDPANPLPEVNLTKIAIALGNRNEAISHLRKAEQLDKLQIYATSLVKLKQQLSAAPPPAPEKLH